MRVELGYTPASTDGERCVQRTLAWEAPHLPGLDHTNMRRWANSATWAPPDSQLLVRHRSLDGCRCVVTNDRNPPRGFAIEFDLGLIHSFAQPGTRRLVAGQRGYFCTPFEGLLDECFSGLGYLEEAPLPMLDPLEIRRDPISGEEVLVAGTDDPLYDTATPISSLGFIESYPINPRDAPQGQVDWGITTLLRNVDHSRWRHYYGVGQTNTADSVSLGGVWCQPGRALAELYLSATGRLTSEILTETVQSRNDLKVKLRWAAAPLSWPGGRPRGWAIRAATSRVMMLSRQNSPESSLSRDTLLGYVREYPSPGWSPLFSATHPAVGDQYVTRSELEATDMGYKVDGVLGYVLDRWADCSSNAYSREIKWASHFGQRRRYVEGARR